MNPQFRPMPIFAAKREINENHDPFVIANHSQLQEPGIEGVAEWHGLMTGAQHSDEIRIETGNPARLAGLLPMPWSSLGQPASSVPNAFRDHAPDNPTVRL